MYDVMYPVNSISKEHAPEVINELQMLLCKGVIVHSHHELDEYISSKFSMPKSDDGIEFVLFAHFKMESIHTILELVDTWLLDGLH